MFSVIVSRPGLRNLYAGGLISDGQPQWRTLSCETRRVVFSNDSGVNVQRDKRNLPTCRLITINFTAFGENEKNKATLLLPVRTFLERRSSFIDLWGQRKDTNQVVNLPVIGGCRVQAYSEKTIATRLGALLGCKINNKTKFYTGLMWEEKLPVYPTQFKTLPIYLKTGVRKVAFAVSTFYVSDFFATDTLSRTSRLLGVQRSICASLTSNYNYYEFF